MGFELVLSEQINVKLVLKPLKHAKRYFYCKFFKVSSWGACSDLRIIFKILIMVKGQKGESYKFVYFGVQYDATDYVQKHPGGKDFIVNMKNERLDFTQYFKSLHSIEAEKILQSFPKVKTGKASKESEVYLQLYEKVKHFYEPIWYKEFLLILLVACSFITAIFTKYPIASIFLFAFSQILLGWLGHSMDHSRNVILKKMSKYVVSLLGGFSAKWWGPKHNMHHMFTNHMQYDDDIKHEYKIYLYPFLYVKWRFDAFMAAVKTGDYVDVVLILTNYSLLFLNKPNIIYFFIGHLVAGLFSAFVLIGNHEKEKRFEEKVNSTFIDHQLITSRNYYQNGIIWLLLMGGMQYQVEHHLFPQIPFYRLPEVVPIIRAELAKMNKSIIFGPVI